MPMIESMTGAVLAIGALGTAAMALVDASKVGASGGISNAGFEFIQRAAAKFFPGAKRGGGDLGGDILDTLHSHWINGVALADQRAIAKSLVKLALSNQSAAQFAQATRLDVEVLRAVADKLNSGEKMSEAESNVWGRFDAQLTVMLDQCYQRADQVYRNRAKFLAGVYALALAVIGGIAQFGGSEWTAANVATILLAGILAVPLAPIAKDLSSALQAGVKVAQALKR